jgi:hypothetical protein
MPFPVFSLLSVLQNVNALLLRVCVGLYQFQKILFMSAGRYSTGSLWTELNESDSKTTKVNTIIRASHWTASCPVYLPQFLTAVCIYTRAIQ